VTRVSVVVRVDARVVSNGPRALDTGGRGRESACRATVRRTGGA
jgi:hypothetical protein